MVYRFLHNHCVRASYGTAFRKPSYIENYTDVTSSLFGITLHGKGNPKLEPEFIGTWEAGYRGSLHEGRINLQLNLFYSEMEDFIALRLTTLSSLEDMLDWTAYSNFGYLSSYGGELSVRLQWADSTTGFVHYAYQALKFTKDDPVTPENEEGQMITAAPKHKVSWGIRYHPKYGISGNVTAHYVSATSWKRNLTLPLQTELDDYLLVDARLAYRFHRDRAEVAIAGYNLLHDKHREYPLGDEIGTRVLLSLRLDF